jgi:diadenosine tetraphosphatase ApaH/serine/threonine PP2A family protein phosphatase
MTLSAIIDDKVFCVHGGLSPAITTLDQVGLIISGKRPALTTTYYTDTSD